MKKIKLTQGKFALVDDEDFEWLNQWKWTYDGNNGYAKRNIKDKKLYMHRLILNTPKGKVSDHKNGNKLDNRKINLRICTYSQNGMNKMIQSNNSSGYRGVKWHKQVRLWEARIKKNGEQIFLGLYNNNIEAGIVYNWAALKYFGEFAKFNDILNWRQTQPRRRKRYYSIARNNTSGIIGLNYIKDKNKWRARIMVKQKNIHLGYFINKLDAIRIRNEAIKKFYGGKNEDFLL